MDASQDRPDGSSYAKLGDSTSLQPAPLRVPHVWQGQEAWWTAMEHELKEAAPAATRRLEGRQGGATAAAGLPEPEWRKAISAARACLEAGREHLAAGREAEGELWLRRAMWCDPCDPDPALEMAVRCRFAGQHLKGLHHCEQAEEALRRWENAGLGPDRPPSRWEEQFRRVLYERSIMCFYAARRAGLDSGAEACMAYLCGFPEAGPGWDTALRNLQHYLCPLTKAAGARLVGLPAFGAAAAELCPDTPVASSVSVMRCGGRLWANARCVNYRLDENGRFLMQGPKLHTSNLIAELAGAEVDFTPVRPRLWGCRTSGTLLGGLQDFSERAYAIGLEDVRMYPDEQGEQGEQGEQLSALSMAFVAAQQQFSPHGRIRQVRGRLVSEDGGETWAAAELVRMEPPDRRSACEKNWIPVPGSRWIYGWHPLRICREVTGAPLPCAGGGDGGGPFSRLVTDVEYATPPLWRLFRGSTVPCAEVVPGELWLVVHFKYEGGPLHYVHAVVVLEAGSLRPLRTSVPFYMAASHAVEYCIGMLAGGSSSTLTFLFSTHDSNPRAVTVPRSTIRWGPGPVRSLPASTAPLEPTTAIVTAVYKLYDDTSFRQQAPYEDLLAQLVGAFPRRTIKLHVFCDAASEAAVRRVLAPLPGAAAVHVVEMKDLATWPWSEGAGLPEGRNLRKDTAEYLILQNAKPEFLARAAAIEASLSLPTPPAAGFAGPATGPAALLWIDAGIAKLSGVPEELPFFLDAVTRQGLPPGVDVILPGMREPLPRLEEQGETATEAERELALARRVTDNPCWRFTGGLIGVRTTSAAAWSELCLDAMRWVTARNGGVMTWEMNVWAAMEARGLTEGGAPSAGSCAVKWAGCQTHDVGLLHAVAERWVP